MKAKFLKGIPSKSSRYQVMCYCAFLFLIILGLVFPDTYELPVFAVPTRKSDQKKSPEVMEMLLYSQDGIQKLLTLWSVEVPYSDEAVIPFFEQLGTIANRAFILTDSDIHQRNRQQVIGVIYFYENDWRLPLESWYGNIILDDQIDEVYVLTFRANTYKLKTSIYKYELNKIQSKGLFPLSFDPKKLGAATLS